MFQFLATLPLLLSSPQASGDSVGVRCRTAAEVIEISLLSRDNTEKRETVFDQQPDFKSWIDDARHRQDVASDLSSLPPELFPRFEATGAVNAIAACAEVRSVLDRQKIRFNRRAVDQGSRLKRNIKSRAIVYATSLPAVSDDGKVALFVQTMHCGGRCGSGDLIRAERSENGKWRIAKKYFLFAS